MGCFTFGGILLQLLLSATIIKESFFLPGNLNVTLGFLWQDCCLRLQAVSRNESTFLSSSAALMTGVLIGHHFGKLFPAAAGIGRRLFQKMIAVGFENTECSFFLFCFLCTGALICSHPARSQAHKSPCLQLLHIQSLRPNELYKFNHVEGCLVRRHFLI